MPRPAWWRITLAPPIEPLAGSAYYLSLGVPLILGLYTGWVFPALPQEVGGGAPIPIQLELRPEVTKPWSDGAKVSMLDKSSDALLLLVAEESRRRVLEIPRADVGLLAYKP